MNAKHNEGYDHGRNEDQQYKSQLKFTVGKRSKNVWCLPRCKDKEQGREHDRMKNHGYEQSQSPFNQIIESHSPEGC